LKIGIISVAPPFRGGIAAHTSQLIQTLKSNHDVTCYNFSRQYPHFLFPGKTQYLEPKEYIDESIECLDSINPFSWFKVAKNIKKYNFNFVIFRFWNPFFSPMLVTIARRLKRNNPQIKLIGLFDNFLPHEAQFYDQKFTFSFVSEMNGSIVQSTKVKNELLALCPLAKVMTLFHPLYTKYGKLQPKIKCKEKLEINSKFTILFFGLVRKYKGLDILIESTSILKTIRQDFSVLAVGEAYDDPNPIINLINELNINDVFRWENKFIPDNEIAQYFSAIDLVVLPYRSASQSGIVQIAYHFNKPVIVTNVGGLPEIIEEGKSGVIAPTENPEKLAELISRYLNEAKLSQMSDYISTYKQKYSWESFSSKMLEFVDNL
jgi:D-inositol-3-phosphate glycosyltransferase